MELVRLTGAEIKCSKCLYEFYEPYFTDVVICPNCGVLLIDYREGIDALFP